MKKFFKLTILMIFEKVFRKDLEIIFDETPEAQIVWSKLIATIL
jgi:hypothetical protein